MMEIITNYIIATVTQVMFSCGGRISPCYYGVEGFLLEVEQLLSVGGISSSPRVTGFLRAIYLL